MFHPRFDGKRRSGFDRRWIKTDYGGPERRSGRDRRADALLRQMEATVNTSEEGFIDAKGNQTPELRKLMGIQQLLISSLIQLEAVTRLLLSKGVINAEELAEELRKVDEEYQGGTEE